MRKHRAAPAANNPSNRTTPTHRFHRRRAPNRLPHQHHPTHRKIRHRSATTIWPPHWRTAKTKRSNIMPKMRSCSIASRGGNNSKVWKRARTRLLKHPASVYQKSKILRKIWESVQPNKNIPAYFFQQTCSSSSSQTLKVIINFWSFYFLFKFWIHHWYPSSSSSRCCPHIFTKILCTASILSIAIATSNS